jgi:hypothetical protein
VRGVGEDKCRKKTNEIENEDGCRGGGRGGERQNGKEIRK